MLSLRALSFLSVTFALASALAFPQAVPRSLCDGGGGVDCCTTVYELDSYEAQIIVGAMGMNATNLPEGQIATTCGGGGVNVGGGSTCENIPVCCTHNYYGIGVGCSPVPVSL